MTIYTNHPMFYEIISGAITVIYKKGFHTELGYFFNNLTPRIFYAQKFILPSNIEQELRREYNISEIRIVSETIKLSLD